MDPLFQKIVSVSLGLLFLLASVHKLTAIGEFRAVLSDYRIVPAPLEALFSYGLPVAEVTLGLAWMLLFTVWPMAIVSALLFLAYAAAIAVNLRRGRVHIDCGCGFGRASEEQPLSSGLVVRNVALAAIALFALLPASDRTLGIYDYLSLVAAVLTATLIFIATNQLIRNGVAIRLQRGKGRHHHA